MSFIRGKASRIGCTASIHAYTVGRLRSSKRGNRIRRDTLQVLAEFDIPLSLSSSVLTWHPQAQGAIFCKNKAWLVLAAPLNRFRLLHVVAYEGRKTLAFNIAEVEVIVVAY